MRRQKIAYEMQGKVKYLHSVLPDIHPTLIFQQKYGVSSQNYCGICEQLVTALNCTLPIKCIKY